MAALFEYEMRVRDYECDVQGHVNNANYLHYYETTRHLFLEQTGLNFYELHQQGIDAVVSKAEITYKMPLIGMDTFVCRIVSLERVGIRYVFQQDITRLSDGALCSKARIDVVCLENGKLSFPQVIEDAFKAYL